MLSGISDAKHQSVKFVPDRTQLRSPGTSLRRTAVLGCFILCAWVSSLTASEVDQDVFGKQERDGGALIGILYDFKQTQQRQSTSETSHSYLKILARFIDQGWDEGVLNRYFRATRPLYTTQIWMPSVRAERAPQAFGVGDVVRGTMWVVHYKGQVSPPEDGTYRFVGLADNVLCVAVNGQTCLVSYIRESKIPSTLWQEQGSSDAWMPTKREKAANGIWLNLKKNETVDLDILVGERPGGSFYAWLMVEQQGKTYVKDEDGRRRIPPFQLQSNELSRTFSGAPTWTGHQ